MMNWSAMGKQERQLVVLGCIVGGAALIGLYQFVLVPMAALADDPNSELSVLKSNLEEAKQIAGRKDQLLSQHQNLSTKLEDLLSEQLPENVNPLSWVTRALYEVAREAGVEVESLEPVRVGGGVWDYPGLNTYRSFAVRMSALCGYDEMKKLVGLIEERYSLATVGSVLVQARSSTPRLHAFELVVEWPMLQEASRNVPPVGERGGTPQTAEGSP